MLYHHTDSARLPWILHSRALRPGRNAVGNFPDPDFLWATADARGDRSASVSGRQAIDAWRNFMLRQVRFLLADQDFDSWPDAARAFPAWTAAQIARLEAKARGADPRSWRCRVTPLPLEHWLGVQTRGYGQPWKAFALDTPLVQGDPWLGVVIEGTLYCSEQQIQPNGGMGYRFSRQHQLSKNPG